MQLSFVAWSGQLSAECTSLACREPHMQRCADIFSCPRRKSLCHVSHTHFLSFPPSFLANYPRFKTHLWNMALIDNHFHQHNKNPTSTIASELQMIRPHDIRTSGRARSEGSTIPREQQSALKNALKAIPVPPELHEGIDVVRVYANGKTKRSYITLSEDKFTLYITSEKFKKKQQNRANSIFPWRNKNNVGYGGASQPKKSSGTFAGLQQHERAIDIGAIHSIQRGHATRKFELAR